MILVYQAGRRVSRVRGLLWFTIALAVAFAFWGIDLYRTYGLRPADGGQLAPHGVRLAWLAALLVLGVGSAVGMAFYARAYIAALWYDAATDTVQIRTVGLWRSRQVFPRAQIRAVDFHAGDFWALDRSVEAPWYTIRIHGRRRALILDAQGTIVDRRLLGRVLGNLTS